MNHIIELAPIDEIHRSILLDVSDTITAIALQKKEAPDYIAFISSLLQDPIAHPEQLLPELFSTIATQYQTPLIQFAEEHWPTIQELSPTFRTPQTLTEIHQSITSLIPEREIPLPQLPGSNQTTFEIIPSDTAASPETTDNETDTPPEEALPLISEDIDREVWLVENAGLVIFTPYIEMLLARADLLENQSFPSFDHATRAAFLLHYLVTGENQAEEHQLLLNKVLCNIPLDQALPLSITPEENWKELTTGLINAVIQHWGTLGDASPESLISTFVQREGSLRYDQEEGWSLHVSEGPYDMLLTSLPWSISTIDLPWMNQPLRVEWK